jgi:hypothetical protein
VEPVIEEKKTAMQMKAELSLKSERLLIIIPCNPEEADLLISYMI